MDVNEKLQQFGQSLDEISNKEYRQIEQEVDNEIKAGIEEEIKEARMFCHLLSKRNRNRSVW